VFGPPFSSRLGLIASRLVSSRLVWSGRVWSGLVASRGVWSRLVSSIKEEWSAVLA
jgi:hypothetical protein